ncbi:B3 domain-containing protein Os03g0184500-like [Impatiens glandulifera]|uniref:B3 domain-containing protein Os03g0184500-like n=1 Tax=Impatiens glandulifera TaxID=253017 RepID=UPI001FB06948|nr:B3 domain-containing protein Os03g0184500-like [Impatiens glandulifera]
MTWLRLFPLMPVLRYGLIPLVRNRGTPHSVAEEQTLPMRKGPRTPRPRPIVPMPWPRVPWPRPQIIYIYKRKEQISTSVNGEIESTRGVKRKVVDVLSLLEERVTQILESLGDEFPIFIKEMGSEDVTQFFMNFCSEFAKSHLPEHTADITLIDEDGMGYSTKYLAATTRLSARWRRFSIDHKLVKGDVLIFQLISHLTMKVYIVRVQDESERLEAAHNLLDLAGQGNMKKHCQGSSSKAVVCTTIEKDSAPAPDFKPDSDSESDSDPDYNPDSEA